MSAVPLDEAKVQRALDFLRLAVTIPDAAETVGFLADLCRRHIEAGRLVDPMAVRPADAVQAAHSDAAFQAFMTNQGLRGAETS